jgi:ketosteroid isomerase-like protein
MSAMKPEDCDLLIFEYMRQKNIEAVVDLFEPGATFILEGGSLVRGHDAIREAVKGWIDAEKLEWTYGPIAYEDASGSIALLRGTWSATFRDEAGTVSTSTGKNVEIVRRQPDGTWRFVIDHARGAD